MKKTKIIILALVTLLVAGGAVWSGWMMAGKQKNNETPTEEKVVAQEAGIYFYRANGIYKITSNSDEPQQLVKTSFVEEMPWQFNSRFELMGENTNLLVYRDVADKDEEKNQVDFGLIVYDMENKEEVMSVKDGSVGSFIVSPSKKMLAFTVSKKDPEKKVSNGPEPMYVEVYVWDKEGGSKKIITEDSGFFGVGLGMWLDDKNFTIGRGYEGISYCAININTDDEIPKDCQGYGSSHMGMTDKFESLDDGVFYGFRQEWEEILGNRNTTKGIFKKMDNADREYISSDIPSSMVAGKESIFYLRHSRDGSKYSYNGAETDLYLVSKKGDYTKRLTNDGASVLAKGDLSISDDKRFVGYHVTNISKIQPDKNNVRTRQENSSIWLYDTELNKYYQVVENGLSPKIVVKSLEN